MTDVPASAATDSPNDDAQQNELNDAFEQKAVRLAKRERLLVERADAAGGPYPVTVPVTDTIPAVRARFGELEAGEETGVTVGVAGRIVFSRNTGKLCFASLRSEEHTSELQSLMRISYAVFCLKKKKTKT